MLAEEWIIVLFRDCYYSEETGYPVAYEQYIQGSVITSLLFISSPELFELRFIE